jgi:acetyl-CoA acetyltransferase
VSVSEPSIRDRAAIVGIGQTPFGRALGRSEYDMALEAILAACADAGVSPKAIDGIVRYDMDTTDEEMLLAALGNPLVRCFLSTAWGGGGAASVLVLAAAAIAAGMAHTVLVYRSRARGKQSVYGTDRHQGGRYWERLDARLPGLNQWHVPHGLVAAFQEMAMIAMRHRIDYGTTDAQYAEVAVAFRGHAVRNPHAVMRTPMTVADHHRSRLIADPLRLFDCCIETDGAVALVLTSAERARDLRQRPAYLLAGAMAGGGHHIRLSTFFDRDRADDGAPRVARQLWAMAGIAPQDVDVAFFYDFFTPLVIMGLEDYGFAAPGEGGPFVAGGALAWPDGRLVCNTNGGQLSEAFIHGLNNAVEAVRQIRGTSTSQVPDCRLAFVAGANTDPTGAVVLRR